MSDQFSEWDRFYAAYESTKTPNGAMQRYKHRRKKAEAKARAALAKRTIAMRRASRCATQAREAARPDSLMMQWIIVEETQQP
jgi:hypothetical protein